MKQNHGLRILLTVGIFVLAIYTLWPSWAVLSKPLDFNKPIPEPDGNVPPDLLINDIAIEVRRLNENRLLPKGFQGTEQLHFKFKSIIGRIGKKIKYNVTNR